MGWVEALEGQKIALDTAPIIAFITREAPYIDLVRPLFRAIAIGQITAVTSTVTFVEVMVRPLREKNTELAAEYREILMGSENVTTLAVTEEIALGAAELRATLNLRTPDAIQVATAQVGGASTFITNDKRLRMPPGLTRVILDELLEKS